MLLAFANWIHDTAIGHAVGGGVPWLWPVCETIHFIGLALLVGCVGVFDLRLLGVAKGLEIGPLQRMIPWAVVGFVLNLTTGMMFFAGDPFQYIMNNAFWIKMLLIVLAGINVLVFYAMGFHRGLDGVAAGGDAPRAARVTAAISLALWLGVIFWGRMMPFIGNSF